MKKLSSYLVAGLLLGTVACQESEFTERYANPAKISETTIEKQYTGFMVANMDYVLPQYRNYFVTLRTSLNHYNQITGWPNESGQYVPGSSGVEDVWYNYYNTLAQYRELENVYAKASAEDQKNKAIFLITAKVYLYDYTQRMVDLHGDIPFTEAGMISANGGDYGASLPKFDSAESLYTLMLDDLKTIATQLNTITLNAGYQKSFTTQDFINKGDLMTWKRYTNSLRLRMLNRVSATASFKARATSEMGEILGNATTYPIVESNAQNVQVNVFDISTNINSKGFKDGLESTDWFGNLAGKVMMDHMNTNTDPRLPILFEPGINAKGKYIGMDPMATNSEQTNLYQAGMIAIYNRYNLSRNQYFPGVIINAANMSFIKAEYYLTAGNDAMAKAAYETGIKQSVEFFNSTIKISNATGVTAPVAATDAQVTAYLAMDAISWANAATSADKLSLIANQKWLHFNIVQVYEGWAEIRRLDLPKFSFQVDNANNQTLPPVRWNYPGNEVTYNPSNYATVRDKDNLNTKIFWDVK